MGAFRPSKPASEAFSDPRHAAGAGVGVGGHDLYMACPVGRLFQTYTPFFKMYTPYARKADAALAGNPGTLARLVLHSLRVCGLNFGL